MNKLYCILLVSSGRYGTMIVADQSPEGALEVVTKYNNIHYKGKDIIILAHHEEIPQSTTECERGIILNLAGSIFNASEK